MAPRAYLRHDIPVLGPIGVAVNGISTTAVPAIGADFLRHGILFFNPSATSVLRIAPAGVTLVSGAGGIKLNPLSYWAKYDSHGGAAEDDNAVVRLNCAWQVVADAAGPFGLTIWNFTDANPAVTNPPMPVAPQNYDVDVVSPKGFNFTSLTTASAQILPANPNRRGALWHNPGPQLKWISPGNLAAVQGAGSIAILPAGELEIRAFGKVRLNCAFNALTANNADPSLTALEYVG